MTTITKASSLMNIDNNSLLSDHINTDKEESTNKKTSDFASIILQQVSMKITLLSQDQDKILQNQANLFIKIEELSSKLEQLANKPVIPPPPPFSLSNSCLKKAEASSIEPEKIIPTLSNKQEPLQSTEEIKKYLNNDNPITNPKEILNSIKNQNKANAIRRTKSFNLTNVSPIPKKEEISTIAEEMSVIIDDSISHVDPNHKPISHLNGIENDKRKKQFTQRKQMFELTPRI